MSETNRQMAKGAAWMVLFKLIERSIGLVSTIILARLLIPEHFGIVAMAMAVVAVLEILGAFNFDLALIQDQAAGRQHYDTAWTLNILFYLFCSLLLVGLAYPMSQFYDEPRLEAVMMALAFYSFLQGFENIGVVKFRTEMRFDKDFRFLLSKKVASFCITIPLAFLLRDYWALLIGMIGGRLVAVILSYIISDYRPRWCLARWRELVNFSKWLLANNILYFARTRSADFIVGKFAGAHALGIYSVAYEISNLPTSELVLPINRAVFAGYSKMANDRDALRAGYLNVIGVVALVTLPAAAGIAVTSDLLIPVILGPNWLEAIPLIQILAFFGAAAALQSNPIFTAIGKPRMVTLMSSIMICLYLPLIITLTMFYGVIGTAWGSLAAMLTMLPINVGLLLHELELRVPALLKVIWRPIVAALVMTTGVLLLRGTLDPAVSVPGQVAQLLTSIFAGATLYALSILALWLVSGRTTGAEATILALLKNKLGLTRRVAVQDVQ